MHVCNCPARTTIPIAMYPCLCCAEFPHFTPCPYVKLYMLQIRACVHFLVDITASLHLNITL